jgi:hypothetical protein
MGWLSDFAKETGGNAEKPWMQRVAILEGIQKIRGQMNALAH